MPGPEESNQWLVTTPRFPWNSEGAALYQAKCKKFPDRVQRTKYLQEQIMQSWKCTMEMAETV